MVCKLTEMLEGIISPLGFVPAAQCPSPQLLECYQTFLETCGTARRHDIGGNCPVSSTSGVVSILVYL